MDDDFDFDFFNPDYTDILQDDVSQIGTDPTTGGGTGSVDWASLFKNFGSAAKDFTGLAKGLLNPKGDLGGLPLLALAAMGNRAGFFNAPTTRVGFQGTIPKYTFERQQTPLAQQRPAGYRPGQGGITYFTPSRFMPLIAPAAPASGGTTDGTSDGTNTTNLTESGLTKPQGETAETYTPISLIPETPEMLYGGIRGLPLSRILPPQTKQPEEIEAPAKSSQQSIYDAYQGIASGMNPFQQYLGDIAKQTGRSPAEIEYISKNFQPLSQLSLQEAVDYINADPLSHHRRAAMAMGNVAAGGSRNVMPSFYGFDKSGNFVGDLPGGKKVGDLDEHQIAAGMTREERPYKPSMSDFMAATGADFQTASNALYGMIGSNQDTRDWNAIMKSPSPLGAALGMSYQPASVTPPIPQTGVSVIPERRDGPLERSIPSAAAGGRMVGGLEMLAKGRYLKGNGDGVSDSIPAEFAGSGQKAMLADGEFVIPARVVSEIGNGSSDAGARKLYAMLDRIEAQAKKAKRGKPSGADRELNKLA